jgi:uncharacterized membrane protein YkoI
MRVIRWLVVALAFVSAGTALAKSPPAVKLTMEQARAIALGKVAGTIVHDELEKEKGRWIYSIEVRPTGETGRRVKEVNLDANTGEIVEVGSEND